MLGVILGALLPVIVTLALGMLAGWRRDEDTQAAESLNRMVLVYALPLALFAGTITVSRQELISEWPLLVALLAGIVLPFVAAFLVDRTVFGRSMEAAALQAMAFGFPAIACVLTDIRLPGVVTGSFKLLGSTVGGISLFASGIILQTQSPQFSLPAAISTLARLLVIPGLATANTPGQRRRGRHWKRIQRGTYALWALIVLHLLLLDGFKTFAPPEVNLVTSAGRYPSAFVQVVGELL